MALGRLCPSRWSDAVGETNTVGETNAVGETDTIGETNAVRTTDTVGGRGDVGELDHNDLFPPRVTEDYF